MAGFALLMGHGAEPTAAGGPAASPRAMAEAWALADSARTGPDSRQPAVALGKLRKAYALSSDPSLLLEVGRLEREVGNLARATYAFEQFFATGAERVPEPRRVVALRQLQAASAGTARLNVQTNVLGASVELEPERGVATASGFGIGILLDAGERRLSLSKPGYETRSLVLELEPGEVHTLRVDLEKAAGGRSEKSGSTKPRWTLLNATTRGAVSL
ncbi:MAG: hypothetical protein K0R38_4011 [Polyangiaceae bacterium]|nr:hypothetical protein [Polyangiaceae bacterium]